MRCSMDQFGRAVPHRKSDGTWGEYDMGARFAEPTINDFLDWIGTLLDKAISQAQRSMEQIERDASRTGQTGNAIARTFEQVRAQFETGIGEALGVLRYAVRETQ